MKLSTSTGDLLKYASSLGDTVRFFKDTPFRYLNLEQDTAPYFLCRELIPGYLNGVTGVYGPPEGYFVDEAACEEFDRSFPPKVKLKLPGQLV